MPVVARGDLRLYYAERGPAQAPPVVLLHGLLLSSRTMERLAAGLPDLWTAYLAGLAENATPERVRELPGIRRLLDALLARPEVTQGAMFGLFRIPN